ncbi:MAG: hypothetical protein ACFFD4_22000 [Candidatus Odinarchaeota archaeon]
MSVKTCQIPMETIDECEACTLVCLLTPSFMTSSFLSAVQPEFVCLATVGNMFEPVDTITGC